MDKNDIITDIIDYWDNQPCGIKKGQGDIGTLEYFKTGSKRRYQVEPHIRDFAGFHQWRGKRVLEIGCGMGWAIRINDPFYYSWRDIFWDLYTYRGCVCCGGFYPFGWFYAENHLISRSSKDVN